MFYTGIGSRQTPENICNEMTDIAIELSNLGYTLRSGGAKGADSAFAKGSKKSEIFVPWIGFNDIEDGIYHDSVGARLILKSVIGDSHYNNLSKGALALHSRNIFQVLGVGLDQPTDFVICWTEGGITKGGTATAIRLANKLNIPVFNLGKPDMIKTVREFIRKKPLENLYD